MDNKYLFRSVVCLSLLCSTAFASTPLPPKGGTANVDQNVYKQSEAEALAEDLKLVAEAKGWTIAEAKADRKAADVIGAIAEKLAVSRPDIFVGAVLSPDPGGSPSLYIKGAADQLVYDVVGSSDVYINIIDHQPFSRKDLEDRKLSVHQILAERGYKNIVTSFDFQSGGRINATVGRQRGLPEQAMKIKSGMPQHIKDKLDIIVSDEDVAVDLSAFGGMSVFVNDTFACTSGWSVSDIRTGVTGVTTAGHCTGINQIVHLGHGTHTMTHQREHRGQWGDIEWKTTTQTEPAIFYATQTSTRNVLSVEPRANITIGESICFYGRSSNSRDCSFDVAATSVSCTVNGVFNNRLVRMNGNSAIGGDSGGGWSWGTRAYGSVKGICGGGAVFSVADLYDEAIGVRVRVETPSGGKLTIRKRGPGNGVVFSSPSGINCGSDCTQTYSNGTVVTLDSVPDWGSIPAFFTGDSDCADGRVTMNRNITCEAFFDSFWY